MIRLAVAAVLAAAICFILGVRLGREAPRFRAVLDRDEPSFEAGW